MNKQVEAVTLALAKIERDVTVDALLDEEKQSIAQAVIDSLWTDYVQENESTWPESSRRVLWRVKSKCGTRVQIGAGELNKFNSETVKSLLAHMDTKLLEPAILGGGHE